MLGAGSNTLISDEGIDGLVVRHDDRSLRVVDDHTVELGAGCMMPRVALDCASRGLAGIEFGIGVPGTCGASVYGNAGAFGTEMADVLIDCTSLDPRRGAGHAHRRRVRFRLPPLPVQGRPARQRDRERAAARPRR